MTRRIAILLCLLLAAVLPATAKLREAAMRLPAELAQAERLPVSGRQGWKRVERLTFGPYRVEDVDRSLTKGSNLQLLFYEGAKARQTFGFSVAGGDLPAWRGEAATTVRRRALDLGVEVELRNKSGFAARLAPVGQPGSAWTLQLNETRERPLAGALSGAGRSLEVTGTNRLAGTPFPLGETAGYVFTVSGRTVAAVETLNDGAVWLAPDLAPELRGPVVAAASALLLFEELRKTFPE